MFTGIVEEIGTVNSIKRGARECVYTFAAEKILSDMNIGDSIAVNGLCLTDYSVWETAGSVQML